MPSSAPSSPEPRLDRLRYLDGLRGLAALYVVLHHAKWEIAFTAAMPPLLRPFFGWLSHGYIAVTAFIVLSGYCLMLPVVAKGELGGIGRFYFRRARRILVPYYAAAAFALLMSVAGEILARRLDVPWTGIPSALSLQPPSILTHLFLVHNLTQAWAHTFTPPLWSIGAESQIYVVFPLFLLPAWKRLGGGGAIAAALAAWTAALFLFSVPVEGAFELLVCFALGMAAATVPGAVAPAEPQGRYRALFLAASVLFVVVCLFRPPNLLPDHQWVLVFLVAAGMAAFLAHTSAASWGAAARRFPIRWLASEPLVNLGTISYSLYLVHCPLLPILHAGMRALGWSVAAQLIAITTGGTALCIAAAALFHYFIERHFMPGHPRNRRAAAAAAIVSPAP